MNSFSVFHVVSVCASKPLVTKGLRQKSNILELGGTPWNMEHPYTTFYTTPFLACLDHLTCSHASLLAPEAMDEADGSQFDRWNGRVQALAAAHPKGLIVERPLLGLGGSE